MSPRSLPAKLKGFLRARAAAAAASDEAVKLMGSEARPRAIVKQRRRQSSYDEELIRGIRMGNRIVMAVGAAVLGMVAFSLSIVSSTVESVNEKRRKRMVTEEVSALIMDETRSMRGDHHSSKY